VPPHVGRRRLCAEGKRSSTRRVEMTPLGRVLPIADRQRPAMKRRSGSCFDRPNFRLKRSFV
jgi:hypothetical protein